MKQQSILIFIISVAVGFGIAFLISPAGGWGDGGTTSEQPSSSQSAEDPATAPPEQGESVAMSEEEQLFTKLNCLSCHAVSSLDLSGGATGPDLSQAFTTVEGKHGKTLEEFLKEPTSMVMSGVIDSNPLSDEEIEQVVTALKKAAQIN